MGRQPSASAIQGQVIAVAHVRVSTPEEENATRALIVLRRRLRDV